MNKKLISIPHMYQGFSLTHELSGKIEDVIERLNVIKNSVPDGIQIRLDYTTDYGYYNDDHDVVFVYEERLETDEECLAREKKESDEQQERTAQKRKQLEKLKKELGEE